MDIYTRDAINNKLTKKQDTLVSGTNIKTINGESLLGSGNLTISGGGGSGGSVASAEFLVSNTQLNGLNINGTNYKLLDVKVNDGSSLIIGNNRSLKSGESRAVAIGACESSVASGNSSTTLGYGSTADGGYSTALGYRSRASGSSSTAIGDNSTASGINSIAIGCYLVASGNYSIALGINSTASGNYSTALGYYSNASGSNSIAIGYYSAASGNLSTAIGNSSKVYVPNWVSFDGLNDNSVRTVSLKSTDNIFFRNENVDASKTTQASYTSGKTLTQILNEKQDTLVRINISKIKDEATGATDNMLTFVGFYGRINDSLEKLGLNLETLKSNWKTLMAGEYASTIWSGLCGFLSFGLCLSCFYSIGSEKVVSAITNTNYLGYIDLNGTTPEGHVVFNSETTLKAVLAGSTFYLND